MFDIIQNGIFNKVTAPLYGEQDIGVTPGGVMDGFAFETGNALLNNPKNATALEMVIAPSLRFKEDRFFIITGAKYRDVTLTENNEKTLIGHGSVFFARAGSILEFTHKEYGFRTYLCSVSAKDAGRKNLAGRVRGDFSKIASWQESDGRIRVVEGPEYKYLNDKDLFVNEAWRVTNEISQMGMRIESQWADLSVSMNKNMVSEAVSNGTVQLTPNGPIILLKHRQTVGGYPRIFNVISVDVDMLAQFAPGQMIHFKKVTMDEAHDALKRRRKDILNIQQKNKA